MAKAQVRIPEVVRIPETAWRIIRGSEVMYLTDLWFTKVLEDRYVELFQAEPTRGFYNFIAESMNAVLQGESIAEEIEPVIMNLIDDKMNNRKMALRTGDYVVLQKFYRSKVRPHEKLEKNLEDV